MKPPISLFGGILPGVTLCPLRSGNRQIPPIINLMPLKEKVPTVLLANDCATKAAPQTIEAKRSNNELLICFEFALTIVLNIIAELWKIIKDYGKENHEQRALSIVSCFSPFLLHVFIFFAETISPMNIAIATAIIHTKSGIMYP